MGEHKIGSREEYSSMAQEFCHRLRSQIKESYLTFHGTLKVLILPLLSTFLLKEVVTESKFACRALSSLLTTKWPSRWRSRWQWRRGPCWTGGEASTSFSGHSWGCVLWLHCVVNIISHFLIILEILLKENDVWGIGIVQSFGLEISAVLSGLMKLIFQFIVILIASQDLE